MTNSQWRRDFAKRAARILFKQNGRPLELSDGQADIFDAIYSCRHRRVQVITPTQYGKSRTVGAAVLARILSTNDKFTILAPSQKKAQIIMSYIIDDVFSNREFAQRLELDASEKLDRLRRERSRDHITILGGGGVKVLTLDAKNGKRSIEAAMGFGGNRLILDESALIDDPLYATVKRMLGGYPIEDQFLFEIGNPFYLNHFHRTWHSERYFKIFVDYHQAIREGRFSEEFIEEMREEALFDVFYECKFPEADEIDDKGYRRLLTLDEIEAAQIDIEPQRQGEGYLGQDVGGGGDFNIYTFRQADYAKIVGKNQSNDTMTNVSEGQRLASELGVPAENVFPDDIGIGRGVRDRYHELGFFATGVNVGESATDDRFANKRAQLYWRVAQWIRGGGKLMRSDLWKQLYWIKYKVDSDKRIKIMPKPDIKKENNGRSPDAAESLMLTFEEPDFVAVL